MSNYQVDPLFSNPGIQRDGTVYDSQYFISGQWTRFYKNKPRKIGGYNAVNYGNNEIIRNMFGAPYGTNLQTYLGRFNSLTYVNLPVNDEINLSLVNEIVRTPTTLVSNIDNAWSFDLYTSYTSLYPTPQIIAQVCPNASSINNTTEGPIYFGSITNSNVLTPITDPTLGIIQCSGGVVFLAPLLVAYGNNGTIIWNDPNAVDSLQTWTDTTGAANTNTIANTKIVAAQSVIGAGVPTGLFWSLNSLSRVTYTAVTSSAGVTTYAFANTPIQDGISIISSNSIVNYQQTYYWVGNDQFWMYDGVCRPLPNTMNRDWFFDNINLNYANKIFGIAIPRYDEIWWYYPSKNSNENDSVIVYNVAGQFWFDTQSTRSCGIRAGVFPKPLMADSASTPITTIRGTQDFFILWEHETGTDKVIGNQTFPILSTYAHHFIDICSQSGSQNRLLRNRRVEVDFNVTGNMSLSVVNLMWPSDYYNGLALTDGPYVFNRQTQFVEMASQGRLVSFSFQSNEIGGFYQGGKTLYDWEIGDVNP
jgi:hypothetical protein